MSDKLSRQELIELWLAASDEAADAGAFTAEQREALNRMIEEDAEVRRELVTLGRQQAWLMWHGSNKSDSIDAGNADAVVARVRALIENAEDSEAEGLSRRARLYGFLGDIAGPSGMLFRPPMVFFTLLFAALLGGVVSQQLVSSPRGSSTVAVERSESQAKPAAYLTLANGCSWGSSAPRLLNVGQGVQAGDELALTEGIAEFRLANGVALGIEGPAALMLASPSALVLQYGKLTAHVPWGVDDFKVVTAGCRIVSRNAEFGVSLIGNKLDIHAFAGEVTAASSMITSLETMGDEDHELAAPEGENLFSLASIGAGRALRLISQGEVLKVAGWGQAAPASFVAKLSMSGPLAVTQEYVEQVKASKPVGYWRFETIDGQRVRNEIKSETALLLALVDAPADTAERRDALDASSRSALVGNKQNRAIEFRPDGNWYLRSKSRLPLDGPEYAIELWVKPSHLHLGSIVSLSCGDEHLGGARLELQGGIGDSYGQAHAGQLRYVHRTYKGKPRDYGVSCFSPHAYAVRRWQHFVAVKTKADMKLYLDGKLISTADEDQALPSDAMMKIGLFTNGDDRRKFIGQLDELAIYDRALSAKEIEEHYKAVKQATEQQFDSAEEAAKAADQPKDS
jgi:hypothetical protein